MNYFQDFLRQEVPSSEKKMPEYYRRALLISESILMLSLVLHAVLFFLYSRDQIWAPLVALAATAGALLAVSRMGARGNLRIYTLISVIWCGWGIYRFGWSLGYQHMLLSVLALLFFNVYEPPRMKILSFFGLVAYRILLFVYARNHASLSDPGAMGGILLQILNSVSFMLILACCFALFSSSVQENERQLIINNQELHREAGTDPLTRLPNRRAMLDGMDRWIAENPDIPFCVAIADIDFFKKVNDTWGHACGDYTLKELARLFREQSAGEFSSCRWGGEEFCFFLPGMNLDEAGQVMKDLNYAVKAMQLRHEDHEFSITITIGVEDYDFHSPMQEILEQADRKLYMGKLNGRDQVVL